MITLSDLRQAILDLGTKAADEAYRRVDTLLYDDGSVDVADRCARLADISIRALHAVDEIDQRISQREAVERLVAKFGPVLGDLLKRADLPEPPESSTVRP